MFAAKNTAAPSGEAVYIESVFSTYLYTGNGSTGQTISNGIDLSTKGGMVWAKARNNAQIGFIFDTNRGNGKYIIPSETNSEANGAPNGVTFLTNGFSVQDGVAPTFSNLCNQSGYTYASWTFRKQAKFFDVVTYTGNGSNRTIAHNLGSVPGCIIVKRTDTTADWQVYHRANTANPETDYLVLNTTAATADSDTRWNDTLPTSTVFSLGTDTTVNANGGTYVAYLFAHDAGGFGAAGTDNVISCGSFTTDGGPSFTAVNLGYEPQWLLIKASSGTSNWSVVDNMRGLPVGSDSARLLANLSNAEVTNFSQIDLTATGFGPPTGGSNPYSTNTTYIYIAIRRGPMKTPTSGTSVFSPVSYTATTTTSNDTGFVNDWAWFCKSSGGSYSDWYNYDRLRGNLKYLYFDGADAEATATGGANFDRQNAAYWTGSDNRGNISGQTYISYFFRRAPGFFDVVCYTGTGSTRTVTHNLGVAPELVIYKARDFTSNWVTYAQPITASNRLALNTTDAQTAEGGSFWNGVAPTSTNLSVVSNNAINGSGLKYVAYLFATLAGVSKVGSYTGNGSNQTINCGFAAGARFVMIKRIDSTGNWVVFDTAQGIVSGNETFRYANTDCVLQTANDSIDPDSSGFVVNQNATTNLNINAATYIFLAIA